MQPGGQASYAALHPHHVGGGGVHVHAMESLVASNKLEREEVRRNNLCQFHLVSRVILFPQQGNPPWIVACCLRRKNLETRREASNFVSVKTAKPTPICAYPLATDVSPALRPQRMFHAASVKAPPPPGKGGTDEIDIIVSNLPAKLINQLKIQRPNRLFLAPTCSLSA